MNSYEEFAASKRAYFAKLDEQMKAQEQQQDTSSFKAAMMKRSVGVGDTIEKIAKVTGAALVAKAYTKITGKGCGCGKRKKQLNEAFPYAQEKTPSDMAKGS